MNKIIVLILISLHALFGNWPQIFGPERNAVSPETDINKEWDRSSPEVLWETSLGSGFGGAVADSGKVYILDRETLDLANDREGAGRKDILRCYDLTSGEVLWAYDYGAPGKTGYDGSRACPAVDAQNVYAVGPLGHIICVDKIRGTLKWQKHLINDFGAQRPYWAFSQSPLIYKDLVIINAHGQKGLIALKKTDGMLVWGSSVLGGGASYSSPCLTIVDGQEMLLYTSTAGRRNESGNPPTIAGIDPSDGKMLWSYSDFQCGTAMIPHPVHIGKGRFILTGGYMAGTALIQVARKEGVWKATTVFHNKDYGSQIHQPLFIDEYIYLISNENARANGLVCLNLAGELQWSTKGIQGMTTLGLGSIIYIDGVCILLDGNNGSLYMFEPDSSKFSPIGSIKGLLRGNQIWAPMAVSKGKLLIRDQTTLKCLSLQ